MGRAVIRSVPPVAPPPPLGPVPRPRFRWRRWLVPLVLAAATGAALGVGVAAAVRVPNVDEIARFSPKLVTRLVDRDGRAFATYAPFLDVTDVEVPTIAAKLWAKNTTSTSK